MSPELQPLLLVVTGAIAGVLLLLNVLLKTLAGREKVGFIDVFLVFLTTALLVLALVFDYQASPAGQPLVFNGVLVVAAVLAAFSLLVLLLELRRPERLRDSRGLLLLWAGLLVAISTQTVPLIARNLVPEPEPVQVASLPPLTAEPAPDSTAEADAAPTLRPVTAMPEPTAAASATPTQTPTDRPTASATPTRERFVYSSPTPPPSPTLGNPCVGTVPYNLRLRAEPDAEAETLATIPFGTTIAIYGKDGVNVAWWYTQYEDTYGWVDAEFVQATTACASVPVRAAG